MAKYNKNHYITHHLPHKLVRTSGPQDSYSNRDNLLYTVPMFLPYRPYIRFYIPHLINTQSSKYKSLINTENRFQKFNIDRNFKLLLFHSYKYS